MTSDLPEMLPARMLNEFVYCPRLFYLEWVDARWADSEDTEAGKFTHRVVDRGRGSLPVPEEIDDLRSARSVRLEDPDLGLVAVIDRVDHDDGTASPVDFKKGRPATDGEPWHADRIQVLVQAVLLRRAGYAVESAYLYYAGSNQRVHVHLTQEAADEVTRLATEAREVAARAQPPLPLVSSPKCPRCSLVGLCLPDETNRLLERSSLPPRRIVPRDPDHRPVYVGQQGAVVGVKGGRLTVSHKKELLVDVRLIDVSQLCVHGHVQVTTELLTRLWNRGVPVLWFSYGGWLNGWAQGEPSKYVELRRRQVISVMQGGRAMAAAMITGKIRNCRTLLRRNSRSGVPDAVLTSLKRLEGQASTAGSHAELMGLEGTAARLYFGELTRMLREDDQGFAMGFDLRGRNRRPPRDPINCLLNYVYGLLVKDLVATCLGVGLDPFIGLLHAPRFGRPSLALDLAEEFRPLIGDSVVLQVVNNGEVRAADFMSRVSRGVQLTQQGRRTVIAAYERRLDVQVRHPVFDYRISYRRVMDVQTRMLGAVMMGELPTYVPMTTR